MNSHRPLATIAAAILALAPASLHAALTPPGITAGNLHSFFLKNDGSVWATGNNTNGRLGTGDRVSISTPVPVLTDVKAIATGFTHSLFLKTDGSVWATGLSNRGQFGSGNTTASNTPVQVFNGVQAIAAGRFHSLFLKVDGSVWATGEGSSGQLGAEEFALNPPYAYITTPVQVLSGVKAIAAAESYSFFLKTDGSLWATGENTEGRFGIGNSAYNFYTPVQVLSDVKAVSAGGNHSLFLKNDGSVWSAGLGFGITSVQVFSGAKAISAGNGHSQFLKTDGRAFAMGYNYWGQLGTGDTVDRGAPVQVMSGVQAISSYDMYSLFLKNDGSVWGTGRNWTGQLGTGNTVDVIMPVAVLNTNVVVAPALNAPTSAALTTISATLGGSVLTDNGDAVTGRGIVISETAGNANPVIGGSGVTKVSTSGSTGTFAVPVNGLIPGVAYTFKAYATNGVGTGYSQAASFSTLLLGVVVEQPLATSIPLGGSSSFVTPLGSPRSLTYTIRNVGGVALSLSDIALNGGDAGLFSIMSAPAANVPAGNSTTFTVRYNAASVGLKTTTLSFVTSIPAANPFTLQLNARALSYATDTDGDGLSDAAELDFAGFGFDWELAQPALVATLANNANGAGYYTSAQIHALNIGTPVLAKNPATGLFTLKLALKKSTNLSQFSPFPVTAPQTSVNGRGELEFNFQSPDNAAFYRVEGK